MRAKHDHALKTSSCNQFAFMARPNRVAWMRHVSLLRSVNVDKLPQRASKRVLAFRRIR